MRRGDSEKKLLRAQDSEFFGLIVASHNVCPHPNPCPLRGERGPDSALSPLGVAEGTGRRDGVASLDFTAVPPPDQPPAPSGATSTFQAICRGYSRIALRTALACKGGLQVGIKLVRRSIRSASLRLREARTMNSPSGRVAHLDSASAAEAEGRGFESRRAKRFEGYSATSSVGNCRWPSNTVTIWMYLA
jgi:hypothetical protein